MRPDPDEEWARWVAWLEGPQSPSIWDDVIGMIASRQVWEGFQIVYGDAPEEARKNTTFQTWIVNGYLSRQGSAIRRQVDTDSDVVSLGRLIEHVRRYPQLLSRDRYAVQTAKHQSRVEADEAFDLMIGPRRDHIDPWTPRADAARLKTNTSKVVRWVHNEVAHYNRERGQFSQDLTFGDVHGAIAQIVDLFLKYHDLIVGRSVVPAVTMHPWIAIFRVPWIPHDRFPDVNARVLETERIRRAGYDWETDS